ncbi:MAG: pH regulation protein F [Thiotrichaceae bacterium]|nr:pH regulation protein F [Thiotrichaceae bacterium]PCI10892.1 MAG: pH regulation protein F [Thiotrichales bacterium]PCI13365.1 MAG: pH regulation protein F [Thiotrichales bacterium]
MATFYMVISVVLLLTLSVGLWRVLRGPSAADRMMASQLFGTTAVVILLLLAPVFEQPALRDVALVFALLAAVTVVAFVRCSGAGGERQDEEA